MRYILFALTVTLFSCGGIDRRDSRTISMEPLDTVKTRPANLDARPLLFEAAFMPGTTHKVKDSIIRLYAVTIGKLKISSGHIVACDPGHIDEYGIPFTQEFPKGEYPVQLAIAKLGYDETIAYARINFSDESVQRWEFALQKGQSPLPVGGKEMHGYSVDLGIGMFADEEASKAIDKTNLTSLDAALYKEMDKNYRNDWRFTMHSFGPYNLAAFSSGFGDGYYATYIGFDAAGKPCRLLTDFGFFHWK